MPLTVPETVAFSMVIAPGVAVLTALPTTPPTFATPVTVPSCTTFAIVLLSADPMRPPTLLEPLTCAPETLTSLTDTPLARPTSVPTLVPLGATTLGFSRVMLRNSAPSANPKSPKATFGEELLLATVRLVMVCCWPSKRPRKGASSEPMGTHGGLGSKVTSAVCWKWADQQASLVLTLASWA